MRSAVRRLPGRLRRRLAAEVRPRVQASRGKVVDALAGAQRRTGADAVALTFDDGPHPGTTDRVLDLLGDAGVRATFFCVGRNAVAHPGLLRRIRAEGHAIGSHSWSHPDPQRAPLRALAEDYRRGHLAVAEALGEPVRLFRPPRGWLDPVRAVQLRRLGLRPTLWSLDPQDWHPDAEASAVEEAVAGSRPGDVVLLHDWIEQPWHPRALTRGATLSALPAVLERLTAVGTRFTTLG
ncbi:polysaccharide deacetylase family protein [Microlunatus kandeliicorticis]|uniref:polysaccharide deacetylase family protein n=1 Tax=Microlunatus kandeliicorticis TaxID=1759536 RepID=UPI0015FE5137|nr:polysaccharide deacetylase family protein [Microlunatus kandeliicorticis]